MVGRGGDIRAESSDAPPSKVQRAKKSKQNNKKPMAQRREATRRGRRYVGMSSSRGRRQVENQMPG